MNAKQLQWTDDGDGGLCGHTHRHDYMSMVSFTISSDLEVAVKLFGVRKVLDYVQTFEEGKDYCQQWIDTLFAQLKGH